MLRIILFCIVAFAGYYVWAFFPINHGPGITAPNSPTTSRITWEKPFPFKEYNIIPLKKIEGTVRVIKHKRYYFDSKSEYSPVDVLVGWGDLSDERNLDHLHFSVSNRLSDIEFSRPPLPLKQLYQQTALWHLVPSNERIENEIKHMREGNMLMLSGYIVNVESETEFGWRSDTINKGGNEHPNIIIWVTEIRVK